METALLISLVAGSVSISSFLYTAWNARSIERMKRFSERERETSRYIEPLARSAFDLQSRIYNISKHGFMNYLASPNKRDRDYALYNTTFVMAQYFCWYELFRREMQFTSIDRNSALQSLFKIQDDIVGIWSTDSISGPLRVFAGEQRAIGEALVQRAGGTVECMGYGEFLTKYGSGQHPLIAALCNDISSLQTVQKGTEDRLRKLQHALVNLVSVVDSDGIRFSASSLSKI